MLRSWIPSGLVIRLAYHSCTSYMISQSSASRSQLAPENKRGLSIRGPVSVKVSALHPPVNHQRLWPPRTTDTLTVPGRVQRLAEIHLQLPFQVPRFARHAHQGHQQPPRNNPAGMRQHRVVPAPQLHTVHQPGNEQILITPPEPA